MILQTNEWSLVQNQCRGITAILEFGAGTLVGLSRGRVGGRGGYRVRYYRNAG